MFVTVCSKTVFIIHLTGTDAPDQVITKLLTCVEEYTSIRLNELQEQREREEREQIRQEQAQE